MTVRWFKWVLKVCPKFKFSCSHFSEVNDLLDEHWAKNVQREYFQLQSIRLQWQSFAIKNLVYLVWPWYSTWAIQKWKSSTRKRAYWAYVLFVLLRAHWAHGLYDDIVLLLKFETRCSSSASKQAIRQSAKQWSCTAAAALQIQRWAPTVLFLFLDFFWRSGLLEYWIQSYVLGIALAVLQRLGCP